MPHIISSVAPGSLGMELGLRPGDKLLRLNGEAVLDVIDYQHLIAGDRLSVEFERDGELQEVSCEKEEWEELGVQFEGNLLATRLCANHCIFCFVDQMHPGCRESLYVKDDDWRMSLMMGNFITLTNVPDRELERIIRRQASPLYISVHATNPQLRAFLLGNPNGAKLMGQLTRLRDAGLQYHLQVVLCPGYNDGEELCRTIEECAALHPAALSLAVVPVGLTGYREGLTPLRCPSAEEAQEILRTIRRYQKKFYKLYGTRFVYAADELYLLAGQPFPKAESYEDFAQIENGVGMFAQLEEEFLLALEDAAPLERERDLALACGVSIAPRMEALLRAHPIEKLHVRVLGVPNVFFGGQVNVTGLLTGACLRAGLQGLRAEELLLSECMFRAGTHSFLDDTTAEQLAEALRLPIRIVPSGGEELLLALLGQGGELI